MQEIKKKSDLNTGCSQRAQRSQCTSNEKTERQSKKLSLELQKTLLRLPIYTSLVGLMKPSFLTCTAPSTEWLYAEKTLIKILLMAENINFSTS